MIKYIQKMKRMVGLGLRKILFPQVYIDLRDPVNNYMDLNEYTPGASCSRLVISVTEHLVEVVDKLSTTTVVFFRSERILKCMCLYGAKNAYWACSDAYWEVLKVLKVRTLMGKENLGNGKGMI